MAHVPIQTIFTRREVIHKLVSNTDSLDETTRVMASDFDNMVAAVRKRLIKVDNAAMYKYMGDHNKLGLVSSISSVGTINTFSELNKYATTIIMRIKKHK